jgi:hypothetical protein
MSNLAQSIFRVTIPVSKNHIRVIIGKNGETIKKIALDSGNNTKLLYNDETQAIDIQSPNLASLKIAAKAVVTIVNDLSKPVKSDNKKEVEKEKPRYLNALKSSNKKEQQLANVETTANKQVTSAKQSANVETTANKQVTSAKTIKVPQKPSTTSSTTQSTTVSSSTPASSTSYKAHSKVVEIPSTNRRIIKEFRIHPELVKAKLLYQIIGKKGCNIQEICKSIGRHTNIVCNDDGNYIIDTANEISYKKVIDLLTRLERKILNNPENEYILAQTRGYYIRTYSNGRKVMELFEESEGLIQIYKDREQIRYKLASKLKVEPSEIYDYMITDEYNRMYKLNIGSENKLSISIDDIKASLQSAPTTPLSQSSIKMNMYSKWNDDFGIIMIKNELPETCKVINHKSINLKHIRAQKMNELDKQRALELEIVNVDLASILDDSDLIFDDDNNDNLDTLELSDSPTNDDSILEDDLRDIDFGENHTMADMNDEYLNAFADKYGLTADW